ncbi:uncharacterized protein TM35_000031570 [Trypanosoma theileri]|uniref:Mucin-associated surface protein (MASP) n=1 Tax=Trypanosoma theileri TaxID=67003 RepID=A0A1X0P634_9TRYP|nr:uncharacterized protein TM35_000031570 [Trypanosoma theileri]ORC92404.1 hypothetical protein TM35_000031570 [Trypanosoma theileri]
MMMMMSRVMCVLVVVLCCTCGYTMTAAAGDILLEDFLSKTSSDYKKCKDAPNHTVEGINCAEFEFAPKAEKTPLTPPPKKDEAEAHPTIGGSGGDTESQVAEGVDRQGQQEGSNPTRTENDAGEREPEPTESSKRPGNVEVPEGDQGASSSTDDNSTAGNSNANQQSPAAVDVTAAPDSEETTSTTPSSTENTVSEESTATPSRDSNLTQQSTATVTVTTVPNSPETNTTIPPSTENTTTEAPTTTPSPSLVPNAEINTITSALQNKANADSSVSPVWMRTAAPLLIVAVLFSATVY